MFTLYCFDKNYQNYVRLMIMESEGLANLLLSALPYEHVYKLKGKGKRIINKYNGLDLIQIK